MTEAEWLACDDPMRMLEFLRGKVSDRKLRLFAVACCRRMWNLLTDERSRRAVEVAERFADGLAGRKELAAVRSELKAKVRGQLRAAVMKVAKAEGLPEDVASARAVSWAGGWDGAHYAVRAVAWDAASLAHKAVAAVQSWGRAELSGQMDQASYLRDIVGSLPFRSQLPIDPKWCSWNDRVVEKLAREIYDERDFARMPILGDALEDAGCADAEILSHCRSQADHVRGCWVVDAILGKT